MIGLEFGLKQTRRLAGCTFIIVLAAASTAPSSAQIITLADQNSTAQINLSTTAGMTSWVVDGVNQLNQQWYGFRLTSPSVYFSGPAASLDSISGGVPTSYSLSDPAHLLVTYANPRYSVEVDYSLTGLNPGSGASKLVENVTFKNLTGNALVLQFLDYSDFNLKNTTGGQSGQFYANAAGNTYFQTLGQASLTNKLLATSITGGHLSHQQAGLLSDGILTGLKNGTLITLNGTAGAGGGDVTDAAEWDVALNASGTAGSSFILSETLSLANVPEPSALALLALGFTLTALCRRSHSC